MERLALELTPYKDHFNSKIIGRDLAVAHLETNLKAPDHERIVHFILEVTADGQVVDSVDRDSDILARFSWSNPG